MDKGAEIGTCPFDNNSSDPGNGNGNGKDKKSNKKSMETKDAGSLTNEIKIFPNPVTQELNIYFGANASNIARIELFDISGKTVRNIPINDQAQITVQRENIDSGIYFIRFYGEEVFTEKVIYK